MILEYNLNDIGLQFKRFWSTIYMILEYTVNDLDYNLHDFGVQWAFNMMIRSFQDDSQKLLIWSPEAFIGGV